MTRVHPVTGALLVRGTRAITLRYRDQSTEVQMPGWYAEDDLTGDHGLHDPEDMRNFDRALEEMRAASPPRPEPYDPYGPGAIARPGWSERLARLDAIIAEGVLDPDPAALTAVPMLDDWRIVTSPSGLTCLLGKLMKDGVHTGATIHTSPLLRMNLDEGWARVLSAIYRLNAPAPGLALPTHLELARAIERNRELIPTRPWAFEPPDWSSR